MTQNHPERVVSLLIYPKIQVIFAVLALCIIIVLDSSIFYLLPYDGALISIGSREIIQLDKGGPTEKAGSRFGDQIVKINGNSVDPWGQYPAFPSGVKKGESLKYEIHRGIQTLYLFVVVDSLWQHLSFLFVLIGMIFLSIAFWILGVLLCMFAPADDFRARMVGLFLLLAGIVVAAGGPGEATNFWGARTIFTITLCLLAFVGITAHLYFPAPTFSPGKSKQIVNVLAVISLLLALMAALNDLVINAALTSSIGLYKIVDMYMLVSMVVIVGLLFRSRFLIREPNIRRQTNIILWGTILGFAPFFIFTLLPIIIFGTGHEYLDGSYSVLFLIFIPVTLFLRKSSRFWLR